ncbi:19652_t:CDS:1, partial [Dentiscutata erythropus]
MKANESPETTLEQALDQHIEKITKQLNQQRLQAQTNIKNAQEKQKGYYDKNIKSIEFKIDDQVLLYKSANEKVYSNKLREKWKGPYFIYDYGAPRTYKLRTIEEK